MDKEIVYCVLGATVGPNGHNKGAFVVQYGIKNFGFGEITFAIRQDGSLECDSELLSREFVSQVMVELVKRAKFTDGKDNEILPEVVEKCQHGRRNDEHENDGFVTAPDLLVERKL